MVARSENLDDRTVEDTAANCLMLISRVGECGGGGGGKRVFRCKTCMKEFSSFQALGGHRASHKKPAANSNSTGGEEQSSSSLSSSGSVAKKSKKTAAQHLCPICGMEFPMGQALGGHMRKHRNVKKSGGVALVTRWLLPETTTVTTLKKSSSGKRVVCLDWGLDSNESMINLKLELGRTIY